MMLAIYDGRIFVTGDDDGDHVDLLDRETGTRVLRVHYGAEGLLIDPTDAQVEATEQGLPLPPESCAVCHGNPLHDHEWRYRNADGYGVCDDCGRQAEQRKTPIG